MVSTKAATFSAGMSPGMSWLGARIKPPPRPDVVRQAPGLVADLLRRAERQDLLDAHPAEEREPVAELPLHLAGVHHLGLEGVEDVQAHLDQLGKQLLHLAAGVDHHALPARLTAPVELGDPRLDEPPPQPGPEQQPLLLPPVVAEQDPVDVVLAGLRSRIARSNSRRASSSSSTNSGASSMSIIRSFMPRRLHARSNSENARLT